MPAADSKRELADWLRRCLNLRRQVLVTFLGAAIGLALALTFVRARKLDALACVPFFISTVIISGLGLTVVWWMWQAPGLARVLLRAPEINLDWPAPSETAGIAMTRVLLRESARRALVSALVTLVPVIVIALVGPSSTAALSIIFGVSGIAFTTIVFALVLPGHWLTLLVSRYEGALFATLREALVDESPLRPRSATYDRLAIYHILLDNRAVSWDIKFILSFIVAALGAGVSLAALIVTVAG